MPEAGPNPEKCTTEDWASLRQLDRQLGPSTSILGAMSLRQTGLSPREFMLSELLSWAEEHSVRLS